MFCGCPAIFRAPDQPCTVQGILNAQNPSRGMLRACARVSCAAGASLPSAHCPLLEQRFWGPPLVEKLGTVGAGTGSCAGGRARSSAGARCFPDVTHFLSGFSAFSFLCTCLFWTTNKIKRVFITLFPWGCEFRI